MKFMNHRRYGACEWCEVDAAELSGGDHPCLSSLMYEGHEVFLCDGCASRATAVLHIRFDSPEDPECDD